MNPFLVTTGLKDTLGSTGPIVFLGEWAKVFLSERDLVGRETTTLRYHWDSPSTFASDYAKLETLYEDRLKSLAVSLNAYHKVNEDLTYWRILVGPWLLYFIHILFDRYSMLEVSSLHQQSFDAIFVRVPKTKLIPRHFLDFQRLMTTDIWNNSIYYHLVPFFQHITPIELSLPKRNPNSGIFLASDASGNVGLRTWFSKLSLRLFSTGAETVFYGHYFSRKLIILTKLRLRQFPFPAALPPEVLPSCVPDLTQREWILSPSADVDGFELALNSLIPKHIPTFYLEGYSTLKDLVKHSSWPKRPKLIVTGNKWLDDDFFKAWTAERICDGAKLIINQHGGAHGTAKHMSIEDHQLIIANHFLSWGWDHSTPGKVRPFGNTKIVGRLPWRRKKSFSSVILATSVWPRYSYWLSSTPKSSQFLDFLQQELRLVENLPEAIFESLKIRLPSVDYGWAQKSRWETHFPTIRFDDTTVPFLDSISKARLTIHTYNSTTFLESLSLNIPTLIFFSPNLFEIRPEAKRFFEILEDAKIYHTDPDEASAFLKDNWEHLERWWVASATQRARRTFCENLSCVANTPVKTLSELLRDFAAS